MSWTSKQSSLARLRRTQSRVEQRYAPRPMTYIVYRNGRPYKPLTAVRRDRQQLQETLLLVSLLIIGWLWFTALA
jgi:hypothetical protein